MATYTLKTNEWTKVATLQTYTSTFGGGYCERRLYLKYSGDKVYYEIRTGTSGYSNFPGSGYSYIYRSYGVITESARIYKSDGTTELVQLLHGSSSEYTYWYYGSEFNCIGGSGSWTISNQNGNKFSQTLVWADFACDTDNDKQRATFTYEIPASNYTITFNSNGGASTIANQTVNAGSPFTFPAAPATKPTSYGSNSYIYITINGGDSTQIYSNAFSRTKSTYTFAGWSTSSTATTGAAAGSTYTPTSNMTYYAIWTPTTTTEWFNNKVSDLPIPVKSKVAFDGVVVTINDTKAGNAQKTYNCDKYIQYTFSNFTNSSGTVLSDTATLTSSQTVNTNYTNTTINFDSVTLPVYTYTNYTLLGYNTSSTATTALYAPGSAFTPTADTTLYTIWEPVQFVKCRVAIGTIATTVRASSISNE